MRLARLIWNGKPWTDGNNLAETVSRAGLNLAKLETMIEGQETAFDARFDEHDKALRKAGHWGVPTCVIDHEPFFGMDRLPVLEWRLDQMKL